MEHPLPWKRNSEAIPARMVQKRGLRILAKGPAMLLAQRDALALVLSGCLARDGGRGCVGFSWEGAGKIQGLEAPREGTGEIWLPGTQAEWHTHAQAQAHAQAPGGRERGKEGGRQEEHRVGCSLMITACSGTRKEGCRQHSHAQL